MTSELYGDWDKFARILHNLKDNEPEYDEVIRSVGQKIAEKIRELIESQGIDMPALDDEYLADKVSEGYDSRILIRTHKFVDSIKLTYEEDRGDGIMVFIGVDGGTTDTGLSMQELADFIEFGTSRQPARMPFHKSWAMMEHEIMEEVSQRLLAIIEGDLK